MFGILGQVSYLIVSFLDFCRLSYFAKKPYSFEIFQWGGGGGERPRATVHRVVHDSEG